MKSKIVIVSLVALFVVVAFAFGFYFANQGSIVGSSKADLQKMLDKSYAPPQAIFALSGNIKGIFGATINLEINDPNDYLPHVDGSAKKTVLRYASVNPNTTYTLFDQTKRDKNGLPTQTSIKLSDLKTGDYVLVKSSENIRDAEKFNVTAVEKTKF